MTLSRFGKLATGRFGVVFALAGILLLAVALRLPGIHWGLPDATHPDYSYHPDEQPHIYLARNLAQGYLIVGQFMYGGTLYFSLLNAFWHYGTLLAAELRGNNLLADTILFGRYFVVACSVLTVALAYSVGSRLFGTAVGLLSAAFLAISPAHIFLAQNTRPDELSTLLGMLLLWLGALILRGQSARDYLLFAASGLLLGTAVALRFPLAAFGVAPAVAYLLRESGAGWRASLGALLRWRIPLLLITAILAYAVASPYSLLHFKVLLRGLEAQKQFQTTAFPDAVGRGPGLYQYGWFTLRQALGTPLYLLALVGVILACVRRNAARALVLITALAYFIPVTTVTWVVVRYTLPILPLLAILAADAAVSMARPSPAWRSTAAVAVGAAVVWTLLADAAFLKIQAGRNVRELASDWIREHVAQGSSIVEARQYADDVYMNPVIPIGYRHLDFLLDSGAEQTLLATTADHDVLILSGATYRNMDRLGARNPQDGAYALQRVLEGGHYHLATEITEPVRILGIDFSDQFTSQDYTIINPGERIYYYVPAPTQGSSTTSG